MPTKTTADTPARIRRIIDAALRSDAFSYWTSERIDAGAYSRNEDDRDRFARCYDAAEDGADGSTHREAIADMRDYLREYLRDRARRHPFGAGYDRIETATDEHFDALEDWHTTNGSIDQEIG